MLSLNRSGDFKLGSEARNKMHTNPPGKIATRHGDRMNPKTNASQLPALLLAFAALSAQAQPAAVPASAPEPALQSASAELQRVARWVSQSHDNAGMPYLLVDKVNAQVFAFDRFGKLEGSAPALLGMAKGDRLLVSNSMAVDDIPPDLRITPAGRFVSRLAVDAHGAELLVIDYDAAISLHPVVKGTPEERRAERLGSATAADNRISHGCINVPKDFYATVVSPTFTRTKGVVYILPETGTATALFGMQAPHDGMAAGSGTTAMDARAGPSMTAAAPQ